MCNAKVEQIFSKNKKRNTGDQSNVPLFILGAFKKNLSILIPDADKYQALKRIGLIIKDALEVGYTLHAIANEMKILPQTLFSIYKASANLEKNNSINYPLLISDFNKAVVFDCRILNGGQNILKKHNSIMLDYIKSEERCSSSLSSKKK